jgi:hypothetical protein
MSVTGNMVVDGVDFNRLSTDATLKASFTSACKDSIASAAGNIEPSMVEVVLSEGSVKVDYTISVPRGVDAVTKLADASNALATDMAKRIKTIQGIGDVSSGPIKVTDIATPKQATAVMTPLPTTVAIILSVLVVIALCLDCHYHNVFKKEICGREASTRDCQTWSYVSMPTDTLQESIVRDGAVRATYQPPRP